MQGWDTFFTLGLCSGASVTRKFGNSRCFQTKNRQCSVGFGHRLSSLCPSGRGRLCPMEKVRTEFSASTRMPEPRGACGGSEPWQILRRASQLSSCPWRRWSVSIGESFWALHARQAATATALTAHSSGATVIGNMAADPWGLQLHGCAISHQFYNHVNSPEELVPTGICWHRKFILLHS